MRGVCRSRNGPRFLEGGWARPGARIWRRPHRDENGDPDGHGGGGADPCHRRAAAARQRGGTGLLPLVLPTHGSGDPGHVIFCEQRLHPCAQRRCRFASTQPRPPHSAKHLRSQRWAFTRVVDDDRHGEGRPAGHEPRPFGGEVPCEGKATFTAVFGVLRKVRRAQRALADRLFDLRVPGVAARRSSLSSNPISRPWAQGVSARRPAAAVSSGQPLTKRARGGAEGCLPGVRADWPAVGNHRAARRPAPHPNAGLPWSSAVAHFPGASPHR